MPPHIYTVADQAYHDMLQDKENQSILITGESGAGKTENTKIVIQYLTAVANTKKDNKLEQQILQANPILEAFGNAQTIRNNNSSRFGKFIRIEFNMQAQIAGANIEWYLLEKSRVHQQSPKERNYHIFYQLLNADESIKEQLLLGGGRPSDYGFTRDSNSVIEGVNDADDFKTLMNSLDIMGLEYNDQLDLFRIIAAVLHLGNIVVTPDYRGDRADIRDFTSVERVCHLLGIPAQDFKNSLLSPRIKAGRDWVNQSKSPSQVKASLEALAKTLYERNFASLVERVNHAIDGKKSSDKLGFIGVLDIAGFEIFEVNSFEQLCINYTNEKLQQFFNHNMFVLEQEEYQKEKINWSYIDFGLDLQPTIDLIEKTNPIGILSCLEEECVAPRGNDNRFLEKLSKIWDNGEADSKYKSTRFKDGFIVKHYAGNVEYSTTGWIDKNKDPLNEDITRLLARSNQRHVAGLFEDYLGDSNVDKDMSSSSSLSLFKLRKGGGSFRTVGQRHKQQLLSLMNTLYMTHPHFVRCILPNNRKHSGEIQPNLVLDQLRCNGVLEGIRICRKGYPNRLTFADFRKRYEILCPNVLKPNQFIDGRSACQLLLDQMELEPEKYRIGTTKIFFKATVLAELEEVRDKRLGDYITDFQAYCRRFIARRHLTRFARQTEAIKVMQRNARIYVTLREWPWWKMYAMLKPLSEFYETDALLKKQEKQIEEMKEQLEAQQQQINLLTGRNKQLELEQEEYKALLESEQSISRDLQDSKQSLLEEVTNVEERNEELVVALDEARDQIDSLKSQLEICQQENIAQGTMIATLHQDIRDCSDDNDKLAAECEKWTSDYASLQESEQALKDQVMEKNQQLSALKDEHKILLEDHQKDTSDTQLKLTALQEALSNCKAELENETKARQHVEQRCNELEDQLDSIRKTLDMESTQRQEWQMKNQTLQVDWEDLTKLVRSEAEETRSRAAR
ncbi:P-loop containing nucleoside triphosphate hydrolase protein [Halteromyces radiatus]|uniref:P-loop containing nucleoside triphosphate hydrolase protein n=1 Tax=Halteromyces radiatus TaxID=101107 RepID=UPI00221F4B0D|nr:P-loop containing nucleoside triphosphate hydrolase protein [Halteromyces radiatus]KAI8099819.1 P-loop containing nucleoside triphosphate hydrolase protein [Halteromyces radiatus]